MNDAELINHLGGPSVLAKRLKLKSPQQVQNWLRRGIPAAIKVKHPGLFLRKNTKQPAAEVAP